MSKLKRSLLLVLTIVMSLIIVLGGCSQNDTVTGNFDNVNSDTPDTVYEMKIAYAYSDVTTHGKNMLYFKDQVEELTKGRVEVILFANAQLGSIDKEPAMVKAGTVQATYNVGPILATINPLHAIYEIPFLFGTEPGDGRLLRAAGSSTVIQGEIDKKAQEAGFKNLGMIPTNFGSFLIANNERPIVRPGDAKGLKIRTPGGDQNKLYLDSLGVSPTTVSGAEVPTALSQGLVDGLVTSVPFFDSARWYTKYVTFPNYNVADIDVYVNLDWWKGLPKDIQDLIEKEAIPATQEYAYDEIAKMEKELVESIKEAPANVNVTHMDMEDADIKDWVEKTRQAGIALFIQKTGDQGKAMVDEVLKLRKELKLD